MVSAKSFTYFNLDHTGVVRAYRQMLYPPAHVNSRPASEHFVQMFYIFEQAVD